MAGAIRCKHFCLIMWGNLVGLFSRFKPVRLVLIAAAALVLVLVVAGVVSLGLQNRSEMAANATAAEDYNRTVTSTLAPPPPVEPVAMPTADRVPVTDAMALLNDPTRPWTLSVLGDSTGNDPNEWVNLTARKLSTKYGRPVILHTWDSAKTAYGEPVTIGSGPNEPVTIWNGSAPGKGATYATQLGAKIMVAPADLVILNFGHNHKVPDEASTSIGRLVAAVDAANKNGALAVTMQNPQLGEPENVAKPVRDRLRADYATAGYTLIDVEPKFRDAGDVAALMGDDIHPNSAGQLVWADAVTEALGL